MVSVIGNSTNPREIKWDYSLERWFEINFPPFEKTRSYSRPSRRQSTTPNLPRPGRIVTEAQKESRIFGFILDYTSPLDLKHLQSVLHALLNSCISHQILGIRRIVCHKTIEDHGKLPIESVIEDPAFSLHEEFQLQDALKILEEDVLFPQDAPVLVVSSKCALKTQTNHPLGQLCVTTNGVEFCS